MLEILQQSSKTGDTFDVISDFHNNEERDNNDSHWVFKNLKLKINVPCRIMEFQMNEICHTIGNLQE